MGLFKKGNDSDSQTRRRPDAAGDDSLVKGRNKPAFSYYSQRSSSLENTGRRDPLKVISERFRSTQSFWVRHRRLAVMLVLVVLALAAYLSFLGTNPKVVLLTSGATKYFLQEEAVYQQAAAKTLQKSPLSYNKLSINTTEVRRDLLQKYPEIKNVEVELPFIGQRPIIYVEPYKPSFILITSAGGAFLLDSTGRALATTSQIADIDTYELMTVQDKSGHSVRLGARAIPASTVSFTDTVVKALDNANVVPDTLTLSSPYQLEVKLSGDKYFTKFNTQGDPLEQAGTLLATRGRLAKDKVTPAEYIDVRVPGRAYYK
jgi:hypothetical protein